MLSNGSACGRYTTECAILKGVVRSVSPGRATCATDTHSSCVVFNTFLFFPAHPRVSHRRTAAPSNQPPSSLACAHIPAPFSFPARAIHTLFMYYIHIPPPHSPAPSSLLPPPSAAQVSSWSARRQGELLSVAGGGLHIQAELSCPPPIACNHPVTQPLCNYQARNWFQVPSLCFCSNATFVPPLRRVPRRGAGEREADLALRPGADRPGLRLARLRRAHLQPAQLRHVPARHGARRSRRETRA